MDYSYQGWHKARKPGARQHKIRKGLEATIRDLTKKYDEDEEPYFGVEQAEERFFHFPSVDLGTDYSSAGVTYSTFDKIFFRRCKTSSCRDVVWKEEKDYNPPDNG